MIASNADIIECPHCHQRLELETGSYGEVTCPTCRNTFDVLPPHQEVVRVRGSHRTSASKANHRLNYCLGLIFGLVGLFIAQALDPKDGLRDALRGLLMHIIVVAGLGCACYILTDTLTRRAVNRAAIGEYYR